MIIKNWIENNRKLEKRGLIEKEARRKELIIFFLKVIMSSPTTKLNILKEQVGICLKPFH